MSVSKFRDMMESKGCQAIVFLIIMALAVSMIFSTCGPRAASGPELNPEASAIARVGKFPVTEEMVVNMAEQTLSQFRQMLGGQVPPPLVAQYTGNAVEQQINAGLLIELYNHEGVSLDDGSVMRAVGTMLDEEIARNKEKLVAEKKVAADASPSVADAAYKTEFGDDPKAFREKVIKQIEDALKVPAQRNQILVSAANTLLMEKFSNAAAASDEAVKAFYDLYMCKRIFLKDDLHPGEDLIKKAEGIMAEIKGGLKFEDAMVKYTDDTPGPNKPKSDNEFQVDGKTIALNASYGPIAKQTPGVVSGPYSLGDGGVSIVRLDTKVSQLPPDFEQKKVTYKKDFQRDSAAGTLQEKLKGLKEQQGLVKWESPAYEVLFDLTVFAQGEESRKMSPADRKVRYEEFMKRAQAAADDPMGLRAAPLARFWAFNQIWTDSSDADKAKLTDQRIEVLEEVLQQNESADLRLELTDLYASQKDGARVADNLELAAMSIASDFEENGQRRYTEIQAKLLKFKQNNVLNAEQEAKIRKVLDQWALDKRDKDKFDEEQRKAEEQARKEAEAAEKAEKDKAGTQPAPK